MIKALLFDFDGLSMDTGSPEAHVWQAIFGEQGVEFPMDLGAAELMLNSLADLPQEVLLEKLDH